MKKVNLTWSDIVGLTNDIVRQLGKDQWRPDYIVGIVRGGSTPAVMISQYLDVPMYAIKVSLRDSTDDCETNCWMAEDAYQGKKILIVDDINDSGATINWIMKDWQASCLPHDDKWNGVWGNNVRFATLVDNVASDATVTYFAQQIDKVKDPCWIDFPWESWWR